MIQLMHYAFAIKKLAIFNKIDVTSRLDDVCLRYINVPYEYCHGLNYCTVVDGGDERGSVLGERGCQVTPVRRAWAVQKR
jgi:hypothetical protein